MCVDVFVYPIKTALRARKEVVEIAGVGERWMCWPARGMNAEKNG